MATQTGKTIELKAKPFGPKRIKWEAAPEFTDAISVPSPQPAETNAFSNSGDPVKESFLQEVLSLANQLSVAEDPQLETQSQYSPQQPMPPELQSLNEYELKSQLPDANLNAAELVVRKIFKQQENSPEQKKNSGPIAFSKPKAKWNAILVIGTFGIIALVGAIKMLRSNSPQIELFADEISDHSKTTLAHSGLYKNKNAVYFQTMDRLLQKGEVNAVKKHLAKNRPAKIQTEIESIWARTLLARWELIQGSTRKTTRLLEKDCTAGESKIYPECIVHIRALMADKRFKDAEVLIQKFWNLNLSQKDLAPLPALRLLKTANDTLQQPTKINLALLQDAIFESTPYSAEAKIQIGQWFQQVVLSSNSDFTTSEARDLVRLKKDDWRTFFESEDFRELSDPEKILISYLK